MRGNELRYVAIAFSCVAELARLAERLAALPPELLATPTGRYAQALFALRQGRAEEAMAHFAEAAPQRDGSHLFLDALATLEAESGTCEQAKTKLEALLRDYPSSSWARHAGSFARQLSPRLLIPSNIAATSVPLQVAGSAVPALTARRRAAR